MKSPFSICYLELLLQLLYNLELTLRKGDTSYQQIIFIQRLCNLPTAVRKHNERLATVGWTFYHDTINLWLQVEANTVDVDAFHHDQTKFSPMINNSAGSVLYW